METKKKRKYVPKVDMGGIPPMAHASGCPKSVPSPPKQNNNVDHSSSNPNLVSSSNPSSSIQAEPLNNPNFVSSSNPNLVGSSNPNLGIPSNPRSFFNKTSEELYHNRFFSRPVLLERGAQLDKMTNVNCAVIFGLRHWNSIVAINKKDKAYDGLVRIFYANIHNIEKKQDLKFKSYVRGVLFTVTPDVISKILKVRSPFIENTVTYPYKKLSNKPTNQVVATELYGRPFTAEIKKFYQKYLTNNYRVLNRIVGCNINPKGHNSNFGVHRAHLLYAIGTGISIDLPRLIFNEIVSAFEFEDKRKSLPFPILISKIIKGYGVAIHPTDTYKSPMSPFGECTLKKSLGQTNVNDPDYDDQEETETDGETDGASSEDNNRTSTSGDGDNNIVQMLNHMLAKQEELQQQMKDSLKQIREETKESLNQLREDTKESIRQLQEDTKESVKQLEIKLLTQKKK